MLTNDTGSNFVRGAITAVCDYADWRGRIDADVAVFELDEAHAVRFVDVVRPDRVLLLNVMRDQLDRFGEIDTTAGLLRRVAAAATTAVVLNRDDERLVALADSVTAPVTYFGVAPELRADFPTDEELYGVDETARDAPSVPEATAVLLGMELGETSRLSLQIAGETHQIALRAGWRAQRAERGRRRGNGVDVPAATADRGRRIARGRTCVRAWADVHRGRTAAGAAPGQEPGRIPADAAHRRRLRPGRGGDRHQR